MKENHFHVLSKKQHKIEADSKALSWDGEALLGDFISWPKDYRTIITGLSIDSRTTEPGNLFIAHSGPIERRAEFIQQAIQKGARVVLREKTPEFFPVEWSEDQRILFLALPHLRQQAGLIAAKFYHYPSASMKMVGITGTNGKTSCSHFIARSLASVGERCGIIGTIGNGFPDHLEASGLTTPDATMLQRDLSKLKERGASVVAMEVSSHSLDQDRVSGIDFDIAVLTNLTRDHLDYHGDMAHYAQAKEKLFLMPGLRYAVINADDEWGRKCLEKFSDQLSCYAYTLENRQLKHPMIMAESIKQHAQGMAARVKTPWGEGVLKTNLLGRFNLSNLLATLTTLGILGIPLDQILTAIRQLGTVSGRMQTLGGGKLPMVVVDYCHTPDALEKTLTTLREHCQGQLWCVFGCGGDRDKGKRPLMGQIAERYSDQLIITDDNPRFEKPEDIVEDIMSGILCPWAVEIEHDRQAAIAHAIDCAQPADIVLVAGKGHENYQHSGSEKIPFNDAEIVLRQLKLKHTIG